ncbi:MFS transporter [Planotetraspora thailandica]|uniref:MFS transporter n=1 Tax=Planotetraspora thailandica TaxID=487172 RepID=A0A8J3Y2T3_9ACTN|nr:MFS transporter [Planotetraspora thailandica]GII59873.1 MFS transporter [Planotetraspora thailandica]
MVGLDTTIINVALPSAQQALGFSDSSRQWAVTLYALAFGSLLLLGGRLGDLVGRRRMFLIGVLGFAVVSAIGGAAPNYAILLVGRGLQGLFAAFLAPATLSLLAVTFHEHPARAKAFGIFSGILGVGGVSGLVLGGVLSEYLSWRYCMFVNLVLAIPALLGGMSLLRGVHSHPTATAGERADLAGAVLSFGGLFGIVFGFSYAESSGWGNVWTITSLVLGAVLMVAFAIVEANVRNPLLPLRILLDRFRGTAFLALALLGAGFVSVFLFLTYFMQTVLGYSPLQTGLAFVPMVAGFIVAVNLASSFLLPRFGARAVVVTGILIGLIGLILIARLGVDATYSAHILPAILIYDFGQGMASAPLFATATRGVEKRDTGIAGALVNAFQQTGYSIGGAVLSTIAASATARYAAANPGAPRVAPLAAVHGYSTAFWCVVGLYGFSALLCLILFPGHPRTQSARNTG